MNSEPSWKHVHDCRLHKTKPLTWMPDPRRSVAITTTVSQKHLFGCGIKALILLWPLMVGSTQSHHQKSSFDNGLAVVSPLPPVVVLPAGEVTVRVLRESRAVVLLLGLRESSCGLLAVSPSSGGRCSVWEQKQERVRVCRMEQHHWACT